MRQGLAAMRYASHFYVLHCIDSPTLLLWEHVGCYTEKNEQAQELWGTNTNLNKQRKQKTSARNSVAPETPTKPHHDKEKPRKRQPYTRPGHGQIKQVNTDVRHTYGGCTCMHLAVSVTIEHNISLWGWICKSAKVPEPSNPDCTHTPSHPTAECA